MRPFQDVLIEIGARLGLPAFVDAEGAPRYPGRLQGLHRAARAHAPASGRSPAGAARTARAQGRGAPNPQQLDRYIANGCFWKYELPPEQLYLQARQQGLSRNRDRDGADRRARADRAAALCRDRCSASASRRRDTAPSVPPEKDRARIETYFDPLPFWYPPFEEARIDPGGFPLHAITQRPMQMYHSWHSQNAWLRQILGQNRLFINRATARALGLADDDWVWVSSHAGRIEAQIKLMDGVNPDTVWTWNAIGKRSGAWNLAADSPEFTQGISAQPPDLRPAACADGRRCRRSRQRRPDHRPGRLVRSARPRREGARRRGRAQRAALRDAAPPALAAASRRRSCAMAAGSPARTAIARVAAGRVAAGA